MCVCVCVYFCVVQTHAVGSFCPSAHVLHDKKGNRIDLFCSAHVHYEKKEKRIDIFTLRLCIGLFGNATCTSAPTRCLPAHRGA